VELKLFFRERDTVVFTFALPVVLLLLLGSIFRGSYAGTGVSASQDFTAGMLAAGIASTTFVNLGIGIAADRDDGTLKRLRGVPMPPIAYFLGKILLVLTVSLAEVVLIVGCGVLLFGFDLPSGPGRWFTLAWVLVLGTVACSFLGIGASSLARSSRSAGAVMNLPYLVLAFISGIFVTPITALPGPLVQIAALFPLKWLGQGFRAAFLPDSMTRYEAAGAWELGRVALVLGAWCLVGAALCLVTFRWKGRRDG
jgi:ABC-2 type transport system permease protein